MRTSSDTSLESRHPRPSRPSRVDPATEAERPGLLSPGSVLGLQRRAGNSAVSRLVQSVQRDDKNQLSADADPHGFTAPGGVSDVAKSGTTRIEVRDDRYGLSGGFQSTYDNDTWRDSFERKKTAENPDHLAIVIMPDTIDKNRPTQVILHFHGYGYRKGDPFAGYTVSKKRGGIEKGSVRDVDQEHWEQQIGAVNREQAKTGGPQTIAILAQARGPSEFGKVPTYDYVQDILGHVPAIAKNVHGYAIILSAHSGGGSAQIVPKVAAGEAKTADRNALPAAKAGKAPPQPTGMVVMFDATGIEKVMDTLLAQIDQLATKLKTATPDEAKAAIAAMPKFRGYFNDNPGNAYAKRYKKQNGRLCDALDKIPAPWARFDNAHPGIITVSDMYRFVALSGKGVDHEHVISGGVGHDEEGALSEALLASVNPAHDRTNGLPCDASAAPKPAPKPKPVPESKPVAKSKPATKAKPATASKPESKAKPATTSKPAVSAAPGWRASDATNEYALTAENRKTLAGQTAAERAADLAAFGKKARARLKALTKAEKKGTLGDGEAAELAGLRALQDRVGAAQTALKRLDVEDVLAQAGHTVAEWYGQVERGSFLGIPLRVHRALAERLTRAETALVGDASVNPGKLDAAALGGKLKMYASTSDMRRPKAATGGTNLSMHTFGLAVDLNYKGNPFLGNASTLAPDIVKRATRLVLGTPIDLMKPIGDANDAYDTLSTASAALKTYLSYRDSANLRELTDKVGGHSPARGEPRDVAGWLAQIQQDHKRLGEAADFSDHKPAEEGFLDFDKSVVLALTGAGLTWGGTYARAKDIMHFDLREGDGAKVDAARKSHRDNA